MTRAACPADHQSMLLTDFHGQASTIIDAAPAEVFTAITAIDHLPEWNQRIAAVTRTPGTPLTEGAAWTVQMSVPPAKWPSRSRVLTLRPRAPALRVHLAKRRREPQLHDLALIYCPGRKQHTRDSRMDRIPQDILATARIRPMGTHRTDPWHGPVLARAGSDQGPSFPGRPARDQDTRQSQTVRGCGAVPHRPQARHPGCARWLPTGDGELDAGPPCTLRLPAAAPGTSPPSGVKLDSVCGD